MDNQRIKRNLNQLRAAEQIIGLCFEDLKNVQAFRESIAGNVLYREKMLAMLQTIIAQTETLLKE